MADLQVPMPDWTAPLRQLQEQNSPVAQGQAALLQQQATGAGIQNEQAALSLGLFKKALGDFTGQRFQGVVPDDSSGAAPASDTSGETGSGNANTAPPPATMAAAAGAQPGTSAQVGGSQGAGSSPAPAQQGGASTQQGADDSDTVDSGYPDDWNPAELRQQFFVNPAGTAREQAMLVEASLSGNPGLVAMAKAQRDLGVQSRTAESQKQAQDLYDMFGTVASAPKGAALATMARLPGGNALAARIEKEYPGDPTDADAAARATALHVAAVTHQWTGRPLVQGTDGIFRDKVTGMRVPVPVAGMSPADYATLSAKGEAMVSVPNSDGSSSQVPLFRADGAPNLASWVATQAARGQAQLHPAVAPAVAAVAAQARGAGPQQGAGPQPQAGQAQRPTALQQQAAMSPQQAHYNVQLKTALADPEFKIQQPRVVSGQTQAPAALAQQQESVKARAQLSTDSTAAINTAQQVLTYYTAAQAVINSGGRIPTGLSAATQNVIGRAMSAAGITSGDYSTRYQEIVKNLSNAALQAARVNYGSRMTQSEVKLQLGDMSPSTANNPAALKDLINENVRNAAYTLRSAQRVVPYLRQGGDPQFFAQWNSKYFPQAKAVTPNGSGSGAAGGNSPGFVAGQTYRDKNGNTARYLGGGKWAQ